jgi:putative MATE family efflux protein
VSSEEQDAEPLRPRVTLIARLRDRDHVNAGLLGSVIVLALPSVLTGLFGNGLFQLVELRFLGVIGPDAVAAAGAANQILRQVVMMLMFGITITAQMWIARAVGMGQEDQAEHAAGQTLVLGALLSLVSAFVGGVYAEDLVHFITNDAAVAALCIPYVRITFLTMSVMLGVQLFGAILTGAGDTTTPMGITLLVAPVTIVAQWVLAFGQLGFPELGIRGIAWGPAIGGSFGIGIALWALFTGRCRVHVRARHLVPDPFVLRQLLSTAWQPAVHLVARSLIVMVFMWLAGRLGGTVQAAYTIGLRIEMMAVMVAFPIANACATLVGQNLGAGDSQRAWRAVLTSACVEVAILWPAAIAMFFLRHEIVAVFTEDPEVAAMAAEYLFYASFGVLVYGLYFVAFRTLQAAGDMVTPMLISVGVAALVAAPLGFGLATYSDLGATGMWIANLCYALLNGGLMIGWVLTGRWARRPQDGPASLGPRP